MTFSMNSEQLELELFRGLPWDGRSPRVLTKGFIPLFLRQKPSPHEVFFNADQLELWPIDRPHREKTPPSPYGGAPLLVDLPKRRV